LKIRPRLILIPDVSVFYPDEPKERFSDGPPFSTIEILSVDDRLKDVREKVEICRTAVCPSSGWSILTPNVCTLAMEI